jgi:adenosylhomocysteine nucleosidase
MTAAPNIVITISANSEWQALLPHFPQGEIQSSPLGEWFIDPFSTIDSERQKIFFHGGWGKIAAAASTQYIIDRWNPCLLVNLGTCGGVAGQIELGEIVLVERTLVYDIVEQMGDADAAIAAYSTQIDLSWLPNSLPHPVRRSLLISGDRDLIVDELPQLKEKFQAIAGDWESGAIAWVAARNGVRCLILRGVSDLVGKDGDDTYGRLDLFHLGARRVMDQLLEQLPDWLGAV